MGPRKVPPDKSKVRPVIHRPPGPVRNPTTSATSSGSPIRPSAVIAAKPAAASGIARTASVMSVLIGPGATVLTVIPRCPSSLASVGANASTAALLTVYPICD